MEAQKLPKQTVLKGCVDKPRRILVLVRGRRITPTIVPTEESKTRARERERERESDSVKREREREKERKTQQTYAAMPHEGFNHFATLH